MHPSFHCENRFNQTSPSSSNQTQNQLSQLILALNNSSRNNSNELSLYDLQMTILDSIDGMKTQILNLKNDMESRFALFTSKETNSYSSCNLDQLKELLHFRLEKVTRFNNSLTILKKHQEKKTVPSSLFFNRFPKPHLAHNRKFIEGHDKIIQETQVKFLEYDIKMHEEEIKILEEDIESIKTFINKFIIDESAVLAITEEANNTIKSKLKKDFDKSMQKCLNVKMISNLDVFNKPKNLSDNKNKNNNKSKSAPVSLNNSSDSNQSLNNNNNNTVKKNYSKNKNKTNKKSNNVNNNNKNGVKFSNNKTSNSIRTNSNDYKSNISSTHKSNVSSKVFTNNNKSLVYNRNFNNSGYVQRQRFDHTVNSNNFRHQNSFDYNSLNNSNNFFNPNQFPAQSSGPQNYSNFRIPSHLQSRR